MSNRIELTAGGRVRRFALRLPRPRSSGRTTAAAGVGGTRVAAWTVFGGGHTWPGARSFPGALPAPEGTTPPSPPAAGTGPREFDAAEEICRFAGPLLAPAQSRRL